MREGTINVPVRSNSGTAIPSVLRQAMLAAATMFGGCTIRPLAQGAWVGPGGLVEEPMHEMVVAYDPTPENDRKFRGLAQKIAVWADQVCVYCRDASGEVTLIPPVIENAARAA